LQGVVNRWPAGSACAINVCKRELQVRNIREPVSSRDAEEAARPLGKLRQFATDYKELFATIAFFAGGIFWIFGYFATKDELHTLRDATSSKAEILNCLLQKNVQLLEAEQQIKIDSDDLVNVLTEIQTASAHGSQFTESDIQKAARLQHKSEDLKKKLVAAEKSEGEARDAIRFKSCEGDKK